MKAIDTDIRVLEILGELLENKPNRDDLDNARSIAEYIDATEKGTNEGTVKVTFNIASIDNAGIPLEPTERYDAIQYLCGFLSDRFGGASTYDAFGYWRNDAGEIIREANTFVYSYANAADVVPEVLEGIARILARRLRQDAVLLSVEPTIHVSFVAQS